MNYPDYIADKDALYFEDGIWYSHVNNEVSYPAEGNEACFQIEAGSFWFRHRNNCIQTAVGLYSRGERFFDIGGGNGFVAAALQKTGCDVVLIEPGKQGCLNAKARGIATIICGTFQDIRLKESSIGACGLFDVIEHIENDLAILQCLFPLLKNNGKIYVTVPAYPGLWSTEDTDAGHYRRYTIKSITAVLKQAGFKIVYKTYLFSFLPLPIFLTRTLPSLLKKRHQEPDHQKDHANRSRMAGVAEKIMNWELQRIKNKSKVPFGSSCFIVAGKG